MKFMAATGVLLLSVSAFPQATPSSAADARAEARRALSDKADLPEAPPTLPDQASTQAHNALDNTALQKKGTAERAAHGAANKHAENGAAEARSDAANRAAQGEAASEAKNANADVHAAAGQQRATAAKAGEHPGPPSKP